MLRTFMQQRHQCLWCSNTQSMLVNQQSARLSSCTSAASSHVCIKHTVLPLPTASGEANDVKFAWLGTQLPSARRHAGCGQWQKPALPEWTCCCQMLMADADCFDFFSFSEAQQCTCTMYQRALGVQTSVTCRQCAAHHWNTCHRDHTGPAASLHPADRHRTLLKIRSEEC